VRHFLKTLALLFLMAAMPLQNLHAVVMPFCALAGETNTGHQHAAQSDAAGAQEHDHSHHDQTTSDVNLGCDGCGMCNACSAPALASLLNNLSTHAADTPPAVPASHISLFDPERLHRPPLLS
jgi:ABC-type nickel/cobalt efflux system permease component RcnA